VLPPTVIAAGSGKFCGSSGLNFPAFLVSRVGAEVVNERRLLLTRRRADNVAENIMLNLSIKGASLVKLMMLLNEVIFVIVYTAKGKENGCLKRPAE